jgi:ATP synthase protein I
MRYAGIAFQMLLIIGVFTWAGVWLDGRAPAGRTPWFTIGLSLSGLGLALYQVIRSLTR